MLSPHTADSRIRAAVALSAGSLHTVIHRHMCTRNVDTHTHKLPLIARSNRKLRVQIRCYESTTVAVELGIDRAFSVTATYWLSVGLLPSTSPTLITVKSGASSR